MDTPTTSSQPALAIAERAPTASETTARPRSRSVIKRDGRKVIWDRRRIVRALTLAYANTEQAQLPPGDLPNKISRLAEGIEWAVWHRFPEAEAIPIESIQDVAETCIAAAGDWEVARAYVRYRALRAERRPRKHEANGLPDYIAISRYARYRPEWGRRELWAESVQRVRDMHLRRFTPQAAMRPRPEVLNRLIESEDLAPDEQRVLDTGKTLFEEIWDAFEAVEQRRILPSMRSLQFGGAAIEANEARIYNCSFSHADRIAFFRECFFLLLSGVGVGFSVQQHHVAQLPALPKRAAENDLPVRHWNIGDTIEGWADALDALLRSHFEGWLIEFNYSSIRPRGSPLQTSGGRAPGHLPLKRSLEDIGHLLERAQGRHLRPIEVYDLVMFIARAVLAGGIRRSATLCLFSPDDEEMANAKTGNWFETHPHRAYSNNSALLLRESAEKQTFMNLFQKIRGSGEPGFYFAEDLEYGANPCVEIGLCPRATLQPEDIKRLQELGYDQNLKPGDSVSGWQMCNLSTINGAAVKSREDFLQACRQASLLGTLQAHYTRMDYLGPVTRFLNEREALLGVSLCGILDRPDLLLDPATLESGARVVRATNAWFADRIGIRRAARTTCVKPEGTASLLLGAGSGIHPHHAPRYFRRVQVNRVDPVYRHFKQFNPQLTETSVYNPRTDDVITFPVEAPAGALCRADVDAVSFLQYVLTVQQHWVRGGCADDSINPRLHHNVSNTVTVREAEWEEVAEFIWQHRKNFTGVALLSDSGDKCYQQAPREAVTTPEDVARWNRLDYKPVDYSTLREEEDRTALSEVAACAGGKCEI